MKELYLSLFLSALSSLVAYRSVCSSAWLSKALRNLAPTLYMWFMLGFPLFLLGPIAAIYSNDYTVFTVLNLFFICFLFLYLIFYFYGKRESEEVYTWLLLNTKIRVTVVTFLILSLVAFWYFSFLDITVEIILSLSLVEILDVLSIQSLSILSPLIVNFYWLLYSYTWVIKYVSSMPILLLISNGFASGIVIRGFYSSTIGLDMLSFLLETGKVADCSVAMFRVLGIKTSFASIVAARPSTQVFLKQVSTWEKPDSQRFHTENNGFFFGKEESWEEVCSRLPLYDLEKFICKLPVTETSLHHKNFAMHFLFNENYKGLCSEERFKKMLCHLNIDTSDKAKAYGFKVLDASDIVKLGCKDINAVDLSNAIEQKVYAEKLLKNLPVHHAAQLLQYTRASYTSSCSDLVLTKNWKNTFPRVIGNNIIPRTALLVQQESQIFDCIKPFNLRFNTFDESQPTFGSLQAFLLRKDEWVNAASLMFLYGNSSNPIVALEAADVGKGDAVLCFANGDKINYEFTQTHYGYLGAQFSGLSLADKDQVLLENLAKLLVEKQAVSSARVNIYLGYTQQSGEQIKKMLQASYIEKAIKQGKASYSRQLSGLEGVMGRLQEQRVSPRLIAENERHQIKIKNYLSKLNALDTMKIIDNYVITTAANFKKN
jgi:hypothetical protein